MITLTGGLFGEASTNAGTIVGTSPTEVTFTGDDKATRTIVTKDVRFDANSDHGRKSARERGQENVRDEYRTCTRLRTRFGANIGSAAKEQSCTQ
jgi:hypothetical protein